MKLDKRFHLAVAKVAGQKAGECEDCGGISEKAYGDTSCGRGIGGQVITSSPCPTCAPLRKLAESRWHEVDDTKGIYNGAWYCSCGRNCNTHEWKQYHECCNANPTYTIQTIKATLKKLGEWEGFTRWNWMQSYCRCYGLYYDSHTDELYTADYEGMGEKLMQGCIADILTTDSLMLEAATNYLEEK